ncbi:MAG TPA: HD domain-containing protein [Candidatus Scatomonas pullistercoris]|uniref:HD domain-containing protein n=1 Tax=Candidatus Scatomonas pullistercoris TaxID=2840920 RepID=A0A9D1P360_9FIRM|nr:HD domain-containing protein [Candidatus Scatomonas pullistercoris]
MDAERFERQKNFILEIDKEKNILRQTHLSGGGRRENDAEHAWHMAVMAYLLREYANEPLDLSRTMMMILIHDVVEIDAGDTYAYDEAGKATQREREEAAADRIFGLLPEDQQKELRELFEEFEAYETPEARFAHTMDNFQPVLLNDSNGGGDWREHGVYRSQIEKRNEKTGTGSREIWEYMQKIIARNVQLGNLKGEPAGEESD